MSDTKSKYASGGAGSDSALVPTETPTEASGAPAKPAGATAGTTHFPVNAGCVINPRNDYMKKWDLVMLALLLFTAVVTPFEVAFLESKLDFLWGLNRLVDALFLKDLVMNFFMASLDLEQGFWVVEHKEIAKRYLQSWFFIDLTSILPFDTIGIVAESDSVSNLKIFRVIRLLRLFKLFRIFRASRIFGRWEAYISVSYSWISLIKFIVMVLSVSHWMACLFMLVVGLEEFVDANGEALNWVTEYPFANSESPGDMYLTSVYWSVMTLTTIGYGDVAPKTPGERSVALLGMMMGGSIYAYVIGAVCGIVASMDEATTAYHKTMDELNMYMEENKLPRDLRRRLREYFNNCRALNRSRHYRNLLTKMSPMLRGEVAITINGAWVMALPFLRGVPPSEKEGITTEIALRLEIEAFAPNETIVKVGQRADKMYIVQRGVVSMLGRVYRSGDILGDDMILNNASRNYAIRSLTFVSVSTLAKEDFDDIMRSGVFPKTQEAVRFSAIRMSLRREFVHYASSIRALQAVIPSFHGKSASAVRNVIANSEGMALPGSDKMSPLITGRGMKSTGSKGDLTDYEGTPRRARAASGMTAGATSGGDDHKDEESVSEPLLGAASNGPLLLGPGSQRLNATPPGGVAGADRGAGGPSSAASKPTAAGGAMDSELKRVIADAERELGLPGDMPDLDDADFDFDDDGSGGVTLRTGGRSDTLALTNGAQSSPATRFRLPGGPPGLGAIKDVDVDENGKFAKLAAARHKSVEASINATRIALASKLEELSDRLNTLESKDSGDVVEVKASMDRSKVALLLMGFLNLILIMVVTGNVA